MQTIRSHRATRYANNSFAASRSLEPRVLQVGSADVISLALSSARPSFLTLCSARFDSGRIVRRRCFSADFWRTPFPSAALSYAQRRFARVFRGRPTRLAQTAQSLALALLRGVSPSIGTLPGAPRAVTAPPDCLLPWRTVRDGYTPFWSAPADVMLFHLLLPPDGFPRRAFLAGKTLASHCAIRRGICPPLGL